MNAIERFGRRLKDTFEKSVRNGKIARVGGNFSIVVYEKAVWTVITKGPRLGIYEEMTDDKMDFIMITTLDVFEQMYPADDLEPAVLDVEQIIADKKMAMHGNIEVYTRFTAMQGPDSSLSIRMGAAPAKKNGNGYRLKR
jgi:hypothetical protein